jgi:hypothetical protein
MAEGRAFEIVLDEAERRALTALIRRLARRGRGRARASFWPRRIG